MFSAVKFLSMIYFCIVKVFLKSTSNMHTYRPAVHETGTNHKSFLVAIRKKCCRRKMNDSKMATFSQPYFFASACAFYCYTVF